MTQPRDAQGHFLPDFARDTFERLLWMMAVVLSVIFFNLAVVG